VGGAREGGLLEWLLSGSHGSRKNHQTNY